MYNPNGVEAIINALRGPSEPEGGSVRLAGDVIGGAPYFPPEVPNTGPTPNSVPYALGRMQDPKIQSIGQPVLDNWFQRMRTKQSGGGASPPPGTTIW